MTGRRLLTVGAELAPRGWGCSCGRRSPPHGRSGWKLPPPVAGEGKTGVPEPEYTPAQSDGGFDVASA
jgi:hypothetical protein